MRSKLLKRIRNEKRYKIEHKGGVAGFYYSGWWYLTDTRVNYTVRHKKIRNILNYLVKLYRAEVQVKIFFGSLITIISIAIILTLINYLK